MEFDHFRREHPNLTPLAIMITALVIFFILLLTCIYYFMERYSRRRRLRSNREENPSQSVMTIVLPRHQADVQAPYNNETFVEDDVPPDYTVVIGQKTMAANFSNHLNIYPKIEDGKKLETPPPAYITVAPFK